MIRYADLILDKIDEVGRVSLRFMERVNLMNEGKHLDPDMFELSFILNSEEPLSLTQWELLSYTDTEILIQLTFDSPLLVSTGMSPDIISIGISRFMLLPVYEPY